MFLAPYQIQIATDAIFANLVVNTTTPYADYHHNGRLGPGSFYWRVRSETSEGKLAPKPLASLALITREQMTASGRELFVNVTHRLR